MAKFRYKAVDSQGKEVLSTVEADSQGAAIEKIRAMKLTPKAIGLIKEDASDGAAPKPAKGSAPKKSANITIKTPKFLRAKVKTKDLMVFTRQLATLVDAGLPLLRGLRVLHRQAANETLKDALNGMIETVETGNTFSESLGNYPKIFNHLYVNMVKAGEAGGVLETVLNRLAEFMEKAEKIKNKVKGAMTYPIVVLCAALGIVIFLMLAVIPKFQQIFDDLMGGEGMPALTQFVINLSEWVQNYWLFLIAGISGNADEAVAAALAQTLKADYQAAAAKSRHQYRHQHGRGEGCGCGGHGEGGCGCGGHGHGEGECGCGGHGHGEGECGCGGHDHAHGEGCGCGGHGQGRGQGRGGCGCGRHGA